jgi:alpha-D-xyloside xylohydrolase
MTSHTRTHGAPPREPWEYDEKLVVDFRRALELKYTLMPYIIAQAKSSSALGHPMMRALFFEFPEDPTSWLVEDQYLFGADLLVAPLFDETGHRKVYLPPGTWIDYQTGRPYEGAAWHDVQAGDIPIVLMVRNHTVIPHIAVAQSTSAMNWDDIELRVFATDNERATGMFALPDGEPQELEMTPAGSTHTLARDPLGGSVRWRITRAPVVR